MQKRLEGAVVDVCRAFLSTAGVEYVRNYPPVSNDGELTRQVLELSRHFFGVEETHVLDRPLLAGEDFSFYSLECPANFMLLGTGAEYGLHHPKYDVPEELLHLASAWQAFLALTL
jgi:metal-dependent amidase/aminoacylase/carboxypeptidase family protein